MPGKSRNNRKSKKTRGSNRRRFNKRSRTVTFQRGVSPISDVQKLTMRYVVQNKQITTGASPQSIFMRGNSLYDPEYAVGGHQPMGFDQWANFYDRYMVFASHISVTFTNSSATDHIKVAVLPKDEATAVSSFNTICERPYTKCLFLTPNDGGKSVGRLSHYTTTKKILGLKHLQTQDDPFGALFTADPSREWFWHIYAQAINGSTAINVGVNIELTYYVKLFDRKPLPES